MKTGILWLMGLGLGVLSGCSDDGDGAVCGAEEQEYCYCEDGSTGMRTCTEDRSGWGECDCADEGTDTGTGTGAGGGDTGTGNAVSTDMPTDTGDEGEGETDTPTQLDTETATPSELDTGTGAAVDTASDTGVPGDTASEMADTATETGTDADTGEAPDAGPEPDGGDTATEADIPTDTELVDPCGECTTFDGVDLLVVVDNSSSMLQEQEILATGFYTLINSLVTPTEDWGLPAAREVRVGVVSTDMGLQYGETGETGGSNREVPGCTDIGDDGVFHGEMPDEVIVESGQISCDPDGAQCPDATWTCNAQGACQAPGGAASAPVACPALGTADPWTDHSRGTPNAEIVTQVSCLAQLGNEGCGIEQQLQAGIRSLERADQAGFALDNHLLAVIVVSDEEDCSISDVGLFETDEWNDRQGINTACNYPVENGENFLFSAEHFHQRLIDLKDGQRDAVVYAAIVGVPFGADSPCEGKGDAISGCLADDRMQYEIGEFEVGTTTVEHFIPACTREAGGTLVTEARPGRRYVELAEEFGCAGYVYSICNEDWSPAMSEIARMIVKCIEVI